MQIFTPPLIDDSFCKLIFPMIIFENIACSQSVAIADDYKPSYAPPFAAKSESQLSNIPSRLLSLKHSSDPNRNNNNDDNDEHAQL
jgi:hypothetical protein